jgi:hypothetical protein
VRKLKLCPFCEDPREGSAILCEGPNNLWVAVECLDCGGRTGRKYKDGAIEEMVPYDEAIADWNRHTAMMQGHMATNTTKPTHPWRV